MIDFLKDSDGQMSSMRVMSFMIVFMVMVAWCLVSWKQGQLVDLSPEQLGLIAMALGGKAIQKQIEKPGSKPTPPVVKPDGL